MGMVFATDTTLAASTSAAVHSSSFNPAMPPWVTHVLSASTNWRRRKRSSPTTTYTGKNLPLLAWASRELEDMKHDTLSGAGESSQAGYGSPTPSRSHAPTRLL